jgi:hypothetical protein
MPSPDAAALRKAFPVAQWTHHPDGRITLGHELAEPATVTVLPAPRPCSRCRQPTVFGTARGRPVHPGCEGNLDSLTATAMADATRLVCARLPVAEVAEVAGTPGEPS